MQFSLVFFCFCSARLPARFQFSPFDAIVIVAFRCTHEGELRGTKCLYSALKWTRNVSECGNSNNHLRIYKIELMCAGFDARLHLMGFLSCYLLSRKKYAESSLRAIFEAHADCRIKLRVLVKLNFQHRFNMTTRLVAMVLPVDAANSCVD